MTVEASAMRLRRSLSELTFTDYVYNVPTGMGLVLDPANFNKFELWLGVRAFY